MSLLTICEGLAKDVGMEIPDVVVSSASREWKEALAMANAVGEELARRVDWGQLTATATLTGDGTNKEHSLPAAFSRVVSGVGVTGAGGTVRPLSRAEWGSLTATEGVPRYFLLEDSTMTLWPYLANAVTATVIYQSENWCDNGTSAWAADTDSSLIDEDLFLKGLIVRWRRQKGMEYADYEAEYEAAIEDFANFNDRSRL